MKRLSLSILLISIHFFCLGQIGLGEIQPTAALEVKTTGSNLPGLQLNPQIAPVGVNSGQMAVIEDKLYMFDEPRDKWLSVEYTALEFGRLGSGSDPKEVEFGGGDIRTGVMLPFDGTIVQMTIAATADNSREISLYKNNVLVPDNNVDTTQDGIFNLNQTTLFFREGNYNLDFEAGDVINFQVGENVTDISNLVIVAHVKWRKENP